jgi:hypothetical protein
MPMSDWNTSEFVSSSFRITRDFSRRTDQESYRWRMNRCVFATVSPDQDFAHQGGFEQTIS